MFYINRTWRCPLNESWTLAGSPWRYGTVACRGTRFTQQQQHLKKYRSIAPPDRDCKCGKESNHTAGVILPFIILSHVNPLHLFGRLLFMRVWPTLWWMITKAYAYAKWIQMVAKCCKIHISRRSPTFIKNLRRPLQVSYQLSCFVDGYIPIILVLKCTLKQPSKLYIYISLENSTFWVDELLIYNERWSKNEILYPDSCWM